MSVTCHFPEDLKHSFSFPFFLPRYDPNDRYQPSAAWASFNVGHISLTGWPFSLSQPHSFSPSPTRFAQLFVLYWREQELGACLELGAFYLSSKIYVPNLSVFLIIAGNMLANMKAAKRTILTSSMTEKITHLCTVLSARNTRLFNPCYKSSLMSSLGTKIGIQYKNDLDGNQQDVCQGSIIHSSSAAPLSWSMMRLIQSLLL